MCVLYSGLSLQLCCEIDCVRATKTSLLGYFYHKIDTKKKRKGERNNYEEH